ncbi:unnamed protein product [Diplocarpon coronariae]
MSNQAQPPPGPAAGAAATAAAALAAVTIVALMALPPVASPPPFYLINGQAPTALTVQAMSFRDTARAIRLSRLPVRRQLTFKSIEYSIVRLLSDTSCYREAMMAYCVGTPMTSPCKYCVVGNGAYAECIGCPSEPKFNGGCASCHDARHTLDCTDDLPVGRWNLPMDETRRWGLTRM